MSDSSEPEVLERKPKNQTKSKNKRKTKKETLKNTATEECQSENERQGEEHDQNDQLTEEDFERAVAEEVDRIWRAVNCSF